LSEQPDRRPIVAIVVSVVWGVMLVPGLFGVLLSPMMFDAPGSMNNPQAWFMVAIIISFPVLCVVAIAGSWVAWKVSARSRGRAATFVQIGIACLPLLPIVWVAGSMAISMLGMIASGQPMGLHETFYTPVPGSHYVAPQYTTPPASSSHQAPNPARREYPEPRESLLRPIPTVPPDPQR
jgi:hypothetical protein